MADADVTEHTAVVGVVGTAVLGAVVRAGDALHLSVGGGEVGGGSTQNDHTTPLVGEVVRHRTVEGVRLVGENDGASFGAFSKDLASAGYDQCRCVGTLSGCTFHHRSGFNGQGLAAVHEHVALQYIGVVAGPSRGACTGTIVVGNDHDGSGGQRRTVALSQNLLDKPCGNHHQGKHQSSHGNLV